MVIITVAQENQRHHGWQEALRWIRSRASNLYRKPGPEPARHMLLLGGAGGT